MISAVRIPPSGTHGRCSRSAPSLRICIVREIVIPCTVRSFRPLLVEQTMAASNGNGATYNAPTRSPSSRPLGNGPRQWPPPPFATRLNIDILSPVVPGAFGCRPMIRRPAKKLLVQLVAIGEEASWLLHLPSVSRDRDLRAGRVLQPLHPSKSRKGRPGSQREVPGS